MQNKIEIGIDFIRLISVFFIGASVIIGILGYGDYSEKSMMAKNINFAIEKGIDPITVRCAYAPPTDNICLAYSISQRPLDAPFAPPSKR